MPKHNIEPWELIESHLVLDTYTRIEERTYKTPSGQNKKMYIKLTKQPVCILALTEDGKVILVEQFRPGPGKVLLELPGGGIDQDETPEEAAVRELLEETGFRGDMEFVTQCFDDAYATMNRWCFVATNCKQVATQRLDDSEFIDVKVVDLHDFLKIVRNGQMTDVEVAFLGLDKLGLLTQGVDLRSANM